MIVADTSAVVAILLAEPRAAELADRLREERTGERLMSVASYVEAGTVLAGRHSRPERALEILDDFIVSGGISLVEVDERQARFAMTARIRFGRGFGSPAKLNFGDCFAYALAKSLDAPLLFIGDDFTATDIKAALPA